MAPGTTPARSRPHFTDPPSLPAARSVPAESENTHTTAASPPVFTPQTPRRSGRVRVDSAKKRDPNNIYSEAYVDGALEDIDYGPTTPVAGKTTLVYFSFKILILIRSW